MNMSTYRSSNPEVLCKKAVLEVSQNSQKNKCARVSFLIKLQARGLQLYLKRDWYGCFPVNFAKFSRTSFFIEYLWWMLLNIFTVFFGTVYLMFTFRIIILLPCTESKNFYQENKRKLCPSNSVVSSNQKLLRLLLAVSVWCCVIYHI